MTRGSLLVAGAIASLAVGQTISGCWGVGRFQIANVQHDDPKQSSRPVLIDTTLGKVRVLSFAPTGHWLWSNPIPNWSEDTPKYGIPTMEDAGD